MDQKTLKKVIDALKPIEGADTKGLPNETWESVTGSLLVSEATIGYDGHAQLKAMVQNVLIDQAGKHFDPIVTAVESMQVFLTKTFGPIGAKIPLAAAYDLRKNGEFWEAIADITFSIFGFSYSPLLFSYHLLKVSKQDGASIVVKSIVTNWRRLATTFILTLLAVYLFAIAGLLVFEEDHTLSKTDNDHGPCASLLTCFISYSVSGLTAQGLSTWLNYAFMPETIHELLTRETLRLGWEVAFMFLTGIIALAIITGIICDTFGELRIDADSAALYRRTTNFVTGISFAEIPHEPSTYYLNYTYLLLYLSRNVENGERLAPLEQMVFDHVYRGNASWLPQGRCFSSLQRKQEADLVEEKISEIETTLQAQDKRNAAMLAGQKDLRETLELVASRLKSIEGELNNFSPGVRR